MDLRQDWRRSFHLVLVNYNVFAILTLQIRPSDYPFKYIIRYLKKGLLKRKIESQVCKGAGVAWLVSLVG